MGYRWSLLYVIRKFYSYAHYEFVHVLKMRPFINHSLNRHGDLIIVRKKTETKTDFLLTNEMFVLLK